VRLYNSSCCYALKIRKLNEYGCPYVFVPAPCIPHPASFRMKLRVGIVGLGQAWETRHAPALRALADRFEVRAFCDPVAHRAAEIAHRWPARTCDGFRALASSADIDAVLLLSARWYGALPIFAACDAGKAIYCSAALDLETHEASEVRRRVQEAGVAFMAEFPCRLAPATLRLKELMATRLGLPRLLFCNRRVTSKPENGRSHNISDMRQLTEMVDWCRDIVGIEATSVVGASHTSAPRGAAERHEAGPSDYLVMTLDFSPQGEVGTGPVAQIACGSYVAPQWHEAAAFRRPADLQVVCQRGIAFLDLPHTLVWFDDAGQHSELLDHDRPVGEQLFMHFHRHVGSLVLKTSSLEDAYRALAIVNKAQESYSQGCRLEIE
jgi:predicted dehydrogenase